MTGGRLRLGMVGGSVLALVVAAIVGGWMFTSKAGPGRDSAAAGSPEGTVIVREATKPADTAAPPLVPSPSASVATPPVQAQADVDASVGDTPKPAATLADTPKPAASAESTGRHEPTPHPVAHPPTPPVKPVTGHSARPNCNPNYTLDADGNKLFKPECFAH
jgi:hypothetical protein